MVLSSIILKNLQNVNAYSHQGTTDSLQEVGKTLQITAGKVFEMRKTLQIPIGM